jgi:3',5'-cyclic AMP phosphodiesterase CpdA
VRNCKVGIFAILVLVLTGTAFATQDQQIQQKLVALEKLQDKFSFIVIGDNRSGDDVYRKIVSLAMERKPDFIVNTGDMIATPGDKQEWAKFWELSRSISVPYFLTVGNHDIHSQVPFSERTYKDQVDLPGNELYYSFKAGNALFVVLDTYLDDQEKKVTGEQLKWLEGVLSSAARKHTFVFVHHPLYTDKDKGKHHGNSLDRYPKERDALQALFVKHKVTAVFTGHEHLYLRKTVDRVPHIITGGGGAPLYTDDLNGGFYHYIYVTVDGDGVSGEVVDINGKVRDRF